MAAADRIRRIVREEVRAELQPVLRALGALDQRTDIADQASEERAERERQVKAGARAVSRFRGRQPQQGRTT